MLRCLLMKIKNSKSVLKHVMNWNPMLTRSKIKLMIKKSSVQRSLTKTKRKSKRLETNQEAEGEDFKAQKKELEEIVQPIIAKLYQGGAPPPGAGEPEEEDFDKDEL